MLPPPHPEDLNRGWYPGLMIKGAGGEEEERGRKIRSPGWKILSTGSFHSIEIAFCFKRNRISGFQRML